MRLLELMPRSIGLPPPKELCGRKKFVGHYFSSCVEIKLHHSTPSEIHSGRSRSHIYGSRRGNTGRTRGAEPQMRSQAAFPFLGPVQMRSDIYSFISSFIHIQPIRHQPSMSDYATGTKFCTLGSTLLMNSSYLDTTSLISSRRHHTTAHGSVGCELTCAEWVMRT